MTLTYKIAASIVRLLGIKKIFKKPKKEILEYAEKHNAKSAFDIDKAMKRAAGISIFSLIEKRWDIGF